MTSAISMDLISQRHPLSVIVDAIIYGLQPRAGITVYTEEVTRALHGLGGLRVQYFVRPSDRAKVSDIVVPELLRDAPERRFERIRAFPVESLEDTQAVFHSSYYRVPTGRIPVVITVHDMIHEMMISGLRSKILGRQKYRAMKRADAIIAISQSTRDDLIRIYPEFRSKRIEVIHNGVSQHFHPPEAEMREPRILFVGSRKGYKNFGFAAAVMERLPGFRFAIVGGGPLAPDEHKLLEAKLGGRYDFHGAIELDELSRLYQTSMALLYPSLYEGFGLPPLEAMRSGCIAIVQDSSSLPEVVGSAGLVLRNPSADAAASNIAAQLAGGAAENLRQAGYAQAANFSWTACARATRDLYASLAT